MEYGGGWELKMTEIPLNRRRLLFGGAILGVAGVTEAAVRHDGELGGPPEEFRGTMPWRGGAADAPPEADGGGYKFFTTDEAAFVEAAVERLIPKDEVGPGALEAGVAVFIDRQLAGGYGRGDHFFLGGPWPKGTPEQGYQSRFSPAQLYRTAISAIGTHISNAYGGKAFHQLDEGLQDSVLKTLESGAMALDGVDGKTFFTMLLQNTKEGYFSDPIYGGNRDMGGWKMIGFPGAHYDYKEWATRHGQPVPYPPVGFKGRPGWTES
jgi:gluconate 2-dehydrogenase gamma chain